jgi:hypothetical protein
MFSRAALAASAAGCAALIAMVALLSTTQQPEMSVRTELRGRRSYHVRLPTSHVSLGARGTHTAHRGCMSSPSSCLCTDRSTRALSHALRVCVWLCDLPARLLENAQGVRTTPQSASFANLSTHSHMPAPHLTTGRPPRCQAKAQLQHQRERCASVQPALRAPCAADRVPGGSAGSCLALDWP